MAAPGATSALRPPYEHRLGPIRLEEWEGFVFVTLDPAAPRLAARLTGLQQVLSPYRLAGYVPVHQQVDVWRTNWKLLAENFMDAYHVFKVHKATFGADGDHTLDTVVLPGTDDGRTTWCSRQTVTTWRTPATPRCRAISGRRSCSPRCSPRT
ncbi:MAG: SRPBCC family protein [Microthrixaceae bacterium]